MPLQMNPHITAQTAGASSSASNNNVQGTFGLPPEPHPSSDLPSPNAVPDFEIFEWFPAHQSCQRYFLDHAQYDNSVQAVAALVNICLPFQWSATPVFNSSGQPTQLPSESTNSAPYPAYSAPNILPTGRAVPQPWVSLIPFIRRLVITGFDKDAVLHGFFGDDWRKGIGPMQECERRNYLFSAKSGGWSKVKEQYDMNSQETVPFLQPPQNVQLVEIEAAEKQWSQWLALEDWMVGPRAPDSMNDYVRDSAGRSSQ